MGHIVGGGTNLNAQAPMKSMMPSLIKALSLSGRFVLDAAYYWSYKNLPLLELVYTTTLPIATDDTTLTDWGYKYEHFARPPPEHVSLFVNRARQQGK